MMVEEREVLDVLNAIIDPCSAVAGVPAGLVDMGMVQSVEISEGESGATIDVRLLMTEFGCLMSVPFKVTATDSLSALPGVVEVNVGITTADEWTEDRMSPELRQALQEKRRSRRLDLGIPSVRTGGLATDA